MWTSHEAPPRVIQTRLRTAPPTNSPATSKAGFTYHRWRHDAALVRRALQKFPEALAAIITAFETHYGTNLAVP